MDNAVSGLERIGKFAIRHKPADLGIIDDVVQERKDVKRSVQVNTA